MPIKAMPANRVAEAEHLAVLRLRYSNARHLPAAGWLVICISAVSLVLAQHGLESWLPLAAMVFFTVLMMALSYTDNPRWRAASRQACMFGLGTSAVAVFLVLPIYTSSIMPYLFLRGWWWFLALPILASVPLGLLWGNWRAQKWGDEIQRLTEKLSPEVVLPPDDLEGHDVNRWDEGGV